ncbi:unnamed protein product [Linum tenue]|uniref:Uncharacterized protein n=2 Tax=Linum tenue TaxID=586396 RepID=A0AAV0JUP4_9ROSI|nr:unnamed protein product [Linum tenue]
MSMSTMSAAAAPTLSLDQQYHQNQQIPPPSSNSEQLCYVHCNICDTVLAVSVPSASLFKTVTVRCGHCTHLLPVNMRGLIQLPPPPTSPSAAAPSPFNFPHPFFSPTTTTASSHSSNLLFDEIQNQSAATTPSPPPPANLLMFNHHQLNSPINNNDYFGFNSGRGGGLQVSSDELSRPPPLVVNRPPEKRQRVPSAYNRFIKEEIQRIKAENPDISHREAFSAAAKNWAHFPHIHFGLMPDQPLKKTTNTTLLHHTQEAEDHQQHHVLMKDGFFGSANVGLAGAPNY